MHKTNPKYLLGREILIDKKFKAAGTFQSMYAANSWLHENGYDYGSGDAMNPTAITIGKYENLPQKWHNFSTDEKKSVAGIMTGDFREGPVFVKIFKVPE